MVKLKAIFWRFGLWVLVACPLVAAEHGGGDFIVGIQGQVESIAFADLDGDGYKDLVVLAGSGPLLEAVPPLQVFLQNEEGDFSPVTVPPELAEACFLVEVGDYADSPGQEVLLVHPSALTLLVFGPDGNLSSTSLPSAVKPLFHPEAHDAPYLLRCACDLDADGHDDALIPTRKGYAALLGHGNGTFGKPVELPTTLEWSIQFSDNAYFSLMTLFGKVHVLPVKGDRPVVIMETDGRIMGFQMHEDNSCFKKMTSPTAEFGSYSSEVKQGTVEYAGIQFCNDLGDGKTRFVRSHRKGRTGILSELKTTHTVYDLKIEKSMNRISPDPLQRIVTDGIAAAPVFSDLDNDGYKDLVLIYVKTSILTKVLEFFLDRVIITCQSHLYKPDEGRFSFTPDWSQDVPVPTQSVRAVGPEGLVQFNGDFSGDGRPDMLSFDKDRLLLRRGEKDSGWFSSKEISFKSKPFYQIGRPFPGPILCENIDKDESPEIITRGGKIVRIVHVR